LTAALSGFGIVRAVNAMNEFCDSYRRKWKLKRAVSAKDSCDEIGNRLLSPFGGHDGAGIQH
jgi:hypothetical protein